MSKFKKVNFSPDVAALRCLQLLYTAANILLESWVTNNFPNYIFERSADVWVT
jgi:hypothetical protein